MLCLSGFELYSRWVPLIELPHIFTSNLIYIVLWTWHFFNTVRSYLSLRFTRLKILTALLSYLE